VGAASGNLGVLVIVVSPSSDVLEEEEVAVVALDFADSVVVVVVPPAFVENGKSAGALMRSTVVLSAVGSTVEAGSLLMKSLLYDVSLVMIALLDAVSSVLEVGGPYFEAVGSVMHFQLHSVVAIDPYLQFDDHWPKSHRGRLVHSFCTP
jgi:hypothetical protein